MGRIVIPHNYLPRRYQIPVYNCIPQGFRRGVVVWHRRAGKDKTFINILAREAFKRVGTYFYILPYYKQARLIIWEGADSRGFRFIDHFPPEIVKRKENQQMVLELKNPSGSRSGSIIRLLGSDNIDAIVGSNPLGVIFSEYSLHKPAAWNYLRPILLENKGWALFNGTPRGKNALWHMYRAAKKLKGWFNEILTIEDTYDEKGNRIITEEDIVMERLSGMPEELIEQEYYCSFDAGLVGTIVGDLVRQAVVDNRITRVPWEPGLPVYTSWDIGFDDTNTILFFQLKNNSVGFIDCVANNRKHAGYYVNRLLQKPYTYAEHFLPHDVEVHEWGAVGGTRKDTLYDLGLRNIVNIPRMGPGGTGLSEGHHAMRQLLPKCWIDGDKCNDLVEGLKSYRRVWDEKKEAFSEAPVRDWSKHYADAFRIAAWGIAMSTDMGIRDNPEFQDMVYDELGFGDPVNQSYNPLDDYLEFDNGLYLPRNYY